MIAVVIQNIIRAALLLFLQIAVLNNIQLGAFINPYLYIVIILSLPIRIPNWLVLFIGFGVGIAMDIFTSTPGMHTTASTFLAFVRPIVLKYMAPRDGYETNDTASVRSMGYLWYLSHTTLLVFLHHSFLFIVEAFSIGGLIYTLWKAVLSTILTVLLAFILQFWGNQKQLNN